MEGRKERRKGRDGGMEEDNELFQVTIIYKVKKRQKYRMIEEGLL